MAGPRLKFSFLHFLLGHDLFARLLKVLLAHVLLSASAQMASPKTVPVSERALIQRINRALKDDGEMLRAARSPRVAEDIGGTFSST